MSQSVSQCTAAVRDLDRRSSGAAVQRSTCDLLDARSVASHDHDDRPRIFHWPHTQTLHYHCRHSMAIPGDVVGAEKDVMHDQTMVASDGNCQHLHRNKIENHFSFMAVSILPCPFTPSLLRKVSIFP